MFNKRERNSHCDEFTVRLSSEHGKCQQINSRHVHEETGFTEIHMLNVMVSEHMTGIYYNLIRISLLNPESNHVFHLL